MQNPIVRLAEMNPVDTSQEWKENISLFSANNIIVDAKVKNAYFKEHWGPLSVKCAFNGEENYFSKDFHTKVSDTNFLIFNEGRIYGSFIESDHEVESFTIHFSPAFVQRCFYAIHADHACLTDDPFRTSAPEVFFSEWLRMHDNRISPILFEIRRNARSTDPLRMARLEELNFTLLHRLIADQRGIDNSVDEIKALRHSTRTELKKRLTLGLDFIRGNYKSNISLDDVSETACMNKYHFIRQFKETYNTTPHQYVLRLRLLEAARQIKSGRKSVTEVCCETGFSDLASFSKLFKKYYKFSPREYERHFGVSI